jgi:hypothetical protein
MAAASATEISSPTSKLAQPMLGNLPPQVCLLDSEVSTALKTLSHGRHDGQQKALAILKANAARSTTCRKQVITNVMFAMDQPNVDLTAGTAQFFLWHYGSQLLGELKATEALDLSLNRKPRSSRWKWLSL